MKTKVCAVNTDAEQLLPPNQPDGSGIGVNYADAYIKPFNTELEDGSKLACKRKGLKIMVAIGDQKGEALMCKRTHGPDPRLILQAALQESCQAAGATLTVEGGDVYLETAD